MRVCACVQGGVDLWRNSYYPAGLQQGGQQQQHHNIGGGGSATAGNGSRERSTPQSMHDGRVEVRGGWRGGWR